MAKWFKIEGFVDDVHCQLENADEFTDEFLKWCEAKDLEFIGITKEMDETFNS